MTISKIEKARLEAIKNFKPITHTWTIDEVPKCYGSQPQGGEMAWVKGCGDCDVKSECCKLTYKLYDQFRKK